MSISVTRRPLALAAVAASALTGVVAGTGAAQATATDGTGGPDSITSVFGYRVSTAGGGYADVASPSEISALAWAGQGGRMGFIALDGAVYTADPDGSHVVQVAAPSLLAKTNLTWDASSQNLVWDQGGALVTAPADGDFAARGQAPVPFLSGAAAAAVANYNLSAPKAAADANQSVVFQTTSKAAPIGTGVAVATVQNGVQTVTEVVPPAPAPSPQYSPLATSPSISPDGKTIVFTQLAPNDNTKTAYSAQLFSTTLGPSGWSAPVQLTFWTAATSYWHIDPAFESDNDMVVFGEAAPGNSTPSAVGAVRLSTKAEWQVATQTGPIAVRHEVKAQVRRFAGNTRFETAIQASQATWADQNAPSGRKAQSVTLSRSDLFADALGGAGLAAHKNGPLLLTTTATLTPATQTEIQRVLPSGGTVYLLGGDAAISPQVAGTLGALGYHVQRLTGANRYETAVAIADATSASPQKILVATGQKFPDALSAGAVAAAQDGTVVVLTEDGVMPPATAAYLQGKTGAVYAVGGQAKAALSGHAFTPLVGQTRYETSYLVAHELFGSFGAAGVATGRDWPDALAGGAFMGTAKGPLLLVDPAAGLDASDSSLIDANRGSANSGYVFGGSAVLPATIDVQLGGLVATAAGVTLQ